MREDVDCGEEDDGPCGSLVEGDVFVERNDVVQGRPPEERDEIATDWEENEDDVDVKNQGCGTSDGYSREKKPVWV